MGLRSGGPRTVILGQPRGDGLKLAKTSACRHRERRHETAGRDPAEVGRAWCAPVRFSIIKPVSATAALFSPPQSHTQCRHSCKSPYRAAPERDACALAWRVCRSGRRAGSLPRLQNPFVVAASSESGAFNLVLPLAPSFCLSCGPTATPETPGPHSPQAELVNPRTGKNRHRPLVSDVGRVDAWRKLYSELK